MSVGLAGPRQPRLGNRRGRRGSAVAPGRRVPELPPRVLATAVLAGVALALFPSPFLPRAAAQEIVLTVGEERTVSVDPGSQFPVPVIVDMSNAGGLELASLEFGLSWDANLLSLLSVEPGEFGSVDVTESPAGGALTVRLSSATGTTASVTVLTLTLQAGTEEGSAPVVVEPVAAADEAGETLLGAIQRRILGACVGLRGLLGDVTADGSVNIIDAQQIARFAVSLGVGDVDRVRGFGDVTDDGKVDVVDAQQVARFAVGLPTGSRTGQEAAGCLFAPVVSLISPEEGDAFDVGVQIPFEGAAVDVEDGEVKGNALVWTSDLDGALGTGNSLIRDDLSAGDHRIDLTATDSHDNAARAAVEVRVVDLGAVEALLEDPFTDALVAGLTSAKRSAVEAGLSDCDAALSAGDIATLESCLAEARAEAASATDPDDRALGAVLDLILSRAEELLGV